MSTDNADFAAIVLAAGHGTRMRSQTPKMLHTLLGRPMVSYPIDAALAAGAQHAVVVVGHGAQAVVAALSERFDARVTTAVQEKQLGTGDAARSGATALPDFDGWLLILNGDAAVVTDAPLAELRSAALGGDGPLAMLTATLDDATGYGRILRDEAGNVTAVREQRDCSPEQAAIRDYNPGIYAIEAGFFRDAIAKLTTDNAQGELYLTDLVELAAGAGGVTEVHWDDAEELHGVNDRDELVQRERILQRRLMRAHAHAGVTIRDPESTVIGADVEIGQDVTIESGVQLRGSCRIGSGVTLDVGCVLDNVRVADGAVLKPYTVATDSAIGERAQVGPFSHLRPETELGEDVKIGNFVEAKKTRMARGAKASHLSYLGDGIVGEDVNIGCGTIFCNYDGYNKATTVLEDGVFIGSDSQLIAPVTVGKGAYVGTGTTVTQDVPAEAFAIGRARQVNKPGLATRLKAKLKARKQAATKK